MKVAVLAEASGFSEAERSRALGIGSLYPAFAGWRAEMQRDAWKPLSVDTVISDYGTVTWMDRTLDAVVVEARVKLSSSERGEYKQECFLLGAVVDGEFNMMRDPIETGCEGADEQWMTWKTGHELKSHWVAE